MPGAGAAHDGRELAIHLVPADGGHLGAGIAVEAVVQGVVDDGADGRAEPALRGRDHGVHRGAVGHVGLEGEGALADLGG